MSKTLVMLLTQYDIGKALLETVQLTLKNLPIPTQVIAIQDSTNIEQLTHCLHQHISSLDDNQKVLILTDLFGSTPCNLALSLEKYNNVQVVSGLNLPMLLKVMNSPKTDLKTLTERALCGGKEGVLNCGQALQELT